MMQFDDHTRSVLDANGFDGVPFEELRRRFVAGEIDEETCRLEGAVDLPDDGFAEMVPHVADKRWRHFAQVGAREIAAGRVGVVVLNGGMATRFGGIVKGTVEVLGGRSFLDLKINQVVSSSGGKAPVFLMNSFATDRPTKQHLEKIGFGDEITCFNQFVSVRIEPDGNILKDADGKPSLYAPGHGDFPYALVRSKVLDRFIAGGGRWLTLSNVDNLGAGLDPAVIGMHVELQRPMSVELVETFPRDVGGFPAIHGGKMSIIEAFRLPSAFDLDTISYINTNTFVFDAEALVKPPQLDWFVTRKMAQGKPAIQFERLVGQLSEHLEVSWLKVPRKGRWSRFLPVKVPSDLAECRDLIEEVVKAQSEVWP